MFLIKWLLQKDEQLLDFIARRLYHPRIKPVMSFLSHPPGWRFPVAIIILLLLIFGAPSTRLRVGLLLLAVLLSDQTCNLLKAVFKRPRPKGMRPAKGNFWKILGRHSFPSSHAANNFAVAIMVARWFPPATFPLFLWASLVTFSRIYLKNHYPLDALGGALTGTAWGLVILHLFS